MKKRFANEAEGLYAQKRIEEKDFSGYLCYTKIQNVKNPIIVNNGIHEVCIKNNNYEWVEIYPDGAKYVITIIYDDDKNLIEWYFDIAKELGIEDNIPYEIDLYLDLVITPDGEQLILDEEELLEAFHNGEITEGEVEIAYQTLNYLIHQYGNNQEKLIEFTNWVYDKLKDKNNV